MGGISARTTRRFAGRKRKAILDILAVHDDSLRNLNERWTLAAPEYATDNRRCVSPSNPQAAPW
jgi:hypothetical protein